uniref:Uncharacterized protein n=1 Tax=Oryza punctata TaxID=4537 RepID=A0A0E0MM52_ORYPU
MGIKRTSPPPPTQVKISVIIVQSAATYADVTSNLRSRENGCLPQNGAIVYSLAGRVKAELDIDTRLHNHGAKKHDKIKNTD